MCIWWREGCVYLVRLAQAFACFAVVVVVLRVAVAAAGAAAAAGADAAAVSNFANVPLIALCSLHQMRYRCGCWCLRRPTAVLIERPVLPLLPPLRCPSFFFFLVGLRRVGKGAPVPHGGA